VEAEVRIVVIDNGGGGIFDFLPQAGQLDADEFEALLGTPRSLDLAQVAALFGIGHRRIGELAELDEALASGTAQIEVPTDRSENVALHRELTAAAERAVAGALNTASG
jgi:2-succinyl-5-enolpyruvyl-6-hydroxy-3-cyclohexene-1-carboxylate synthase